MLFVISGLQWLLAVVSLVCFILVLIKMFQAGEQTLGIICIVLVLCFGIGGLIAFIFGWINANKWNIKNIMMIWTGAIIASIVLSIIGFSMGAVMIPVQR
jgi:hypothetical protein